MASISVPLPSRAFTNATGSAVNGLPGSTYQRGVTTKSCTKCMPGTATSRVATSRPKASNSRKVKRVGMPIFRLQPTSRFAAESTRMCARNGPSGNAPPKVSSPTVPRLAWSSA